ncbi:MAG: DUF5985 family protein [Stellaceae bacterium]
MTDTLLFANGVLTAGFLALGLFFLKFWRRTRDGFFVLFAAAFALLAANAVASALTGPHSEDTNPSIYLLRLCAFVLIIVAIVRKNVTGRR